MLKDRYGLKVTYADGRIYTHNSSNQYELDMSSSLFQNYFAIEFQLDGQYVAGLYDWTNQPPSENDE